MQKNSTAFDLSYFPNFTQESQGKPLNLYSLFFNKMTLNVPLAQGILSTYHIFNAIESSTNARHSSISSFIETNEDNLLNHQNAEFFKIYSVTQLTPNNKLQFFSLFK